MYYLIRWVIGKLRRRTTSPAGTPVAVPGRDEPAVHTRGERFVTSERVAAPDATRGAPALSVHNLSKRFGARVAFEDVSFEVGYGEVFGFLGPNGAGKTTTVRTLGTLLAPSRTCAHTGGMMIAAVVVTTFPAADRP
jgi:ABC-type glutathione transport system ATPase component